LNLATQVLATAEAKGAAQRSGRSRALTALGPMLALPLGAASAFWLSPQLFFFVLAVIALAGLWVTQKLPQAPHDAPQVAQAPRKLPNSLDTWSFVEGLVIDGLFIIGLSYLGRELLPGNPVLVAGFLLSSRYMAEILLGSAGGRLAEKYSAEGLLLLFSALASVALLGFGLGWLWPSALAILILRALMLPLPPPLVARRTPGAGRIQALATRSVWRDMGAGIGPVLAGMLLSRVPSAWLYGFAALLLTLAALACFKKRVA
jgi:MFS transporter, DHA1 family, inner membrane transport protein